MPSKLIVAVIAVPLVLMVISSLVVIHQGAANQSEVKDRRQLDALMLTVRAEVPTFLGSEFPALIRFFDGIGRCMFPRFTPT